MQSDEVVWQIINHGHCSFKLKTLGETFCKNKYSLTGICNRSSCPLANSRYATVLEERGKVYLCMKTAERSHAPASLWHRVVLDRNYTKALEQVDGSLSHWSSFLVHKSKQRLTKITQFLMRTRRLVREKTKRTKVVTLPVRMQQREARKELKAQLAAQLETSIENELLERLKAGTYDNFQLPRNSKYHESTEKSSKLMSTDYHKLKRGHMEMEYECDDSLQ